MQEENADYVSDGKEPSSAFGNIFILYLAFENS